MLAATMAHSTSTDDPLLAGLVRALAYAGIAAPQGLQRLPDKGLAHDHVRIVGSDWLARIPKQSQMQLSAQQVGTGAGRPSRRTDLPLLSISSCCR